MIIEEDDLNYDPKWKSGARCDGCATLYVDNGRGMWRVKPCSGSRKTEKIRFGVGYIEQRQQRSKVLMHIKGLFK